MMRESAEHGAWHMVSGSECQLWSPEAWTACLTRSLGGGTRRGWVLEILCMRVLSPELGTCSKNSSLHPNLK